MLQLPDIRTHTSFRDYFREFLRINDTRISFRSFAQKISWPPSLLSDLVHGHRGLSVARAIEFGQHFSMTSIEIERLVMLALSDNESEATQGFVKNYLTTEGQSFLTPDVLFVPADEFRQITPIYAFLIWCQGKTTYEEIAEKLDLFPELREREAVEERLGILRRLGLIENDLPELKVKVRPLACRDLTRQDILRDLAPLHQMAERPERKGHLWQTSRLNMAKADYREFTQRLQQLMNWVQNRAVQSTSKVEGDRSDNTILQLSFFVTQLLDLQNLAQIPVTVMPSTSDLAQH